MAILSMQQRKALPKSSFVFPGKGSGSGSYPIPNRSHAVNALARSSGKPVASAVRAKVHAKFPEIGIAPASKNRLLNALAKKG